MRIKLSVITADEPNGNHDRRAEMCRILETREQIAQLLASIEMRRDAGSRLHIDVQNLVEGIRKLIDRIPPENLQ